MGAEKSGKPLLNGGKLIAARVVDIVTSEIEKGALSSINALVVHQTGGSNAQSALDNYKAGGAGAHFLVDKDGTIYQTARVDQKCWHLGNIRSRCYEAKTCTADELKKVEAILFKKGESYSLRVKSLSGHEATKSYPVRYPTNEDSLGIELVGSFNARGKIYDTVTKQQNESLSWLISALQGALKLTADDVYRHPQVSHKQATEADTAGW